MKGHIFIVTYGRSGSTLLQSILNSISGVCIRGENFLAVSHLFKAWRLVGLAEQKFGESYGAKNQPWYGADNIRPDEFGMDLSQAFVKNVLSPPPNCTWTGFKEIRFHELQPDTAALIDFMDRFFKNSIFIYNTRNAEDVAKSGWFRKQPASSVIQMVEECNEFYKTEAAKRPNRSCIISYDRLIENHEHARVIFDLIGEEYNSDLVEMIMNNQLRH